jgi:hypothetical protein
VSAVPTVRRIVVALLPAAALAFGLACEDLGGPNDVQSIQFDSSLQVYPSVVVGEQLRDSNGAVQPLRAIAFNGSGKPIDDAAITYLSFDTLLTVTPGGSVTAKGYRDTPAKIYATAGSLQSNPLNLTITRRPDTLSVTTYALHGAAGFAAESIGVLLQGFDTTTTRQPVNAWIIGWRLEHAGQTIPPTDTSLAWLTSPELFNSTALNTVFKPFAYDTTTADGRSLRVLLIKTAGLAKPLDSIVVFASARYRGAQVKDSPVRVVVRVQQ